MSMNQTLTCVVYASLYNECTIFDVNVNTKKKQAKKALLRTHTLFLTPYLLQNSIGKLNLYAND